jgi:hypothetical protein
MQENDLKDIAKLACAEQAAASPFKQCIAKESGGILLFSSRDAISPPAHI